MSIIQAVRFALVPAVLCATGAVAAAWPVHVAASDAASETESDATSEAVAETATKPATASPACATPAPAAAATTPQPTLVATIDAPKRCADPAGNCAAELTQTGSPAVTAAATRPATRFRFGGGGWYGSRNLTFDADAVENITQYPGISSKGIAVAGEAYPFPLTSTPGQLSGIGFSLALYHSTGSTVGIDTDDETGDYVINQNGFLGAVHWRQPLGIAAIDSEVGYSQDTYIIEDPPEGFEVPDTAYRAFHAGAHVELSITDRASVGFGGRLYYVLGSGDLTSTEFYGPGSSSAFSADTSFIVPLPRNLYIRGQLAYKRIKTSFAGGGIITDEEGVREGTDSTVDGQVNLGVAF